MNTFNAMLKVTGSKDLWKEYYPTNGKCFEHEYDNINGEQKSTKIFAQFHPSGLGIRSAGGFGNVKDQWSKMKNIIEENV